jgi:hypothetical protein
MAWATNDSKLQVVEELFRHLPWMDSAQDFLFAANALAERELAARRIHFNTLDAAKREQNVAFVMAAARLWAAMFQNNTFDRKPKAHRAVADAADPAHHLLAGPAVALDFSGLGFGGLGVRAISLDIQRGHKVEELDISCNMATYMGAAEPLTVVVGPKSELRKLVLSWNRIADGENADALRMEIEEYQDSKRPGDVQMVKAYRENLQHETIAMDRLARVLDGDALPALTVLL